jgi:hypothetical protein
VAHIECECRQGRSVNGETKNKAKTPRRLDFFSLLMQAIRCAFLTANHGNQTTAYSAVFAFQALMRLARYTVNLFR